MRTLAFLLLCAPLLASSPWTTTDTLLEIASEAGIACEWGQMLPVTQPHAGWLASNETQAICGIDAKILGHHPSRARMNTYFAAWEIAHPLISWALPRPYRTLWQGATITFEAIVTSKNKQVGCRVRF